MTTGGRMIAIAAACFIAAVALLYLALIAPKTPRGDRDWPTEFSKVATFEAGADGYRVDNLRAFEFAPNGATTERWSAAVVDPGDLVEVWYFVEPFSANPVFAHSFMSFVFEGEGGERETISISIEARLEAGEDYSAVRGALREYELLYVWSTEKDVLTRIAVGLDHTLYAYKLDLPEEGAREIFEHFVQRTNRLAKRPRFYNTLHSNCTNELAKAVNDAFPGALPWHRSWVLTGRSAAWLHQLGFINEGRGDFEAVQARSDIQPAVKARADVAPAGFPAAWRSAFEKTQRREP